MNNTGYKLLFLLSVFISSCSQIALKKSADTNHKSWIKEILNPVVLLAYASFFFSSLLTVLAYRGIELSWGPVFEATSYVYIMIMGGMFLKEKITLRKIIGNIIIIAGIIVYALGNRI